MRTHAPLFAALGLLACAPAELLAQDTWSEPFPGVRWLHRVTGSQDLHAAVVDLCAPGVSVRTTGHAERGQRTSAFGGSVGAQLAVNGDFCGAGYTPDGLAMHAGALWPGAGDHTYVAPASFGPGQALLGQHWVEEGPPAWALEIVSGHPTILWDGTPVDPAVDPDTGDPLCLNRHPRTAVGLSADRRFLVLAVVDGRATGRAGMRCRELAGLLAELGAATGMNMDGGGSSTFWMAGRGVVNHPSDGTERVVGNHLAVFAGGQGPPAHCPGHPPTGFLDGAGCEAVSGWAQDPDVPDQAIQVHVYFGGPAGDPAAVGQAVEAGAHRDDLCQAIGSCAHGFTLPSPLSLHDGQPHPVHAYGIDTAGHHNPELGSSPRSLQCAPALPAGVRRHVRSPESMAAWRLSHFWHVLPAADDELLARPEGPALPEAPRLVRADDGAPEVWVVDGELRRHVPDPAAMQAWGFDWAEIETRPAAEVQALTLGPPWRARPVLARGSGPAVYALDDAPRQDEPEGGGDDGSGGEAVGEDGGSGPDEEVGGDGAPRDGGEDEADAGADGRLDEDPPQVEGGCASGGQGPGAWGLLALGLGWAGRRRARF